MTYCSVDGVALAACGIGSGSPVRGSPVAPSVTPSDPAADEPAEVVISVELISRRSLRPSDGTASIHAFVTSTGETVRLA